VLPSKELDIVAIEERVPGHAVLILVVAHGPIDPPPGLRVTQHARVVHERLGALVRSAHERDERALHLLKVALKRVEEAARLQVLRRRAHGQPVVLDDIPEPVPIRSDWPEAEQAQRRVPAVRRRQD